MADIDIRRTHDLGIKAARAAADRMAEDLGRKFGLNGGWTGDTHHFDRPGVTGSLQITADQLHLTVKLGLLLKAMRAPLEAAIVRELDQLFEKQAKAPKAVSPAKKKPLSPKTGPVGRKKAG